MEGTVTQLSAHVSADWHRLKYSATDGAGEAVGKQPPCSCHLSGKIGSATGLEMEKTFDSTQHFQESFSPKSVHVPNEYLSIQYHMG